MKKSISDIERINRSSPMSSVWINILLFLNVIKKYFLAMKRIFYIYSKKHSSVLSLFFYLGLVLLSGVLTYKNIIFSKGPVFQNYDMKDQFFPCYYFMKKSFLCGDLPFWDPHNSLGRTAMFGVGEFIPYPLFLIFISLKFLDPLIPRYLELFIIGHFIFSGITMYYSARKIGLGRLGACLSGIVFQMMMPNEYLLYQTCHLAFTYPYIPLAISYIIYFFKSKSRVLSKDDFLSSSIVIICIWFITSISLMHMIYIYLTLGLIYIFFTIDKVLKEKDLKEAIRILGKFVYILLASLLLLSIILLPSISIYKESLRDKIGPHPQGFMPILYLWNFLFPGMVGHLKEWVLSCNMSIIAVLLVFYLCLTNTNQKKDNNFIFIIISIFWLYYAIEGSLLAKILHSLPLLKGMRQFSNGIIIFMYSFSILSGKGLERILDSKVYKFKFNKNWIFPCFIIFMLILSFFSFTKVIDKDVIVNSVLPWIFGLGFILFLAYIKMIKSNKLKIFLANIIPIIVMAEFYIINHNFYGLFIVNNAEKSSPYKSIIKNYAVSFPEAFFDKGLYRIRNFSDYTLVNYYFDKFSVTGLLIYGSEPFRYYLWFNKSLESILVMDAKVLPLNSKLYDLAGVKYFYLPEHEWLFIDYKRSGEGEWIEMELEEEVLVSGIRIYNTSNPMDRRLLDATIVLNGSKRIHIKIPDVPGWHKIYFRPIRLHKLKIIANEVSPLEIWQGTVGVVIGEIEFLDQENNKVDVLVKNFNVSSTMRVSSPSYIIDNRLNYVWESWCDVISDKIFASDSTIEKIRSGCYINKNVLPRAFMVHKYECAKDISELLQKLYNSEEFNPSEVVLLEESVVFYIPEFPYVDNVEITKYKLNEVEVKVENDKAGILILSDVYALGWRVYVDGKRDKLYIADGLFRAVYLKKGKHNVLFKYTPPFLKLGSIISLIILVVIIILGIYIFLWIDNCQT